MNGAQTSHLDSADLGVRCQHTRALRHGSVALRLSAQAVPSNLL